MQNFARQSGADALVCQPGGHARMLTMRTLTTWILSAVLFSAPPLWCQSTADTSWKKLEFLLGKWTGVAGEKDTPQGAGQGGFSFEPELNQKIIVRRNHAGYNSGAQHDDLMVIYLDAPNDSPRAIYFDTEGHVIRYNLSFPATNKAVFESDGTKPGQLFRCTWFSLIPKGTSSATTCLFPPPTKPPSNRTEPSLGRASDCPIPSTDPRSMASLKLRRPALNTNPI